MSLSRKADEKEKTDFKERDTVSWICSQAEDVVQKPTAGRPCNTLPIQEADPDLVIYAIETIIVIVHEKSASGCNGGIRSAQIRNFIIDEDA